MKFDPPLEAGILLRRYKRFLADIQFPDGSETTAHCPNPGAMLGVAPEGARCWVSRSSSKTRKLPLTLEVVECPSPGSKDCLVGINTHRPNKLAEEAIALGLVDGIDSEKPLEREVRYGEERSRIDLLQRGGEGDQGPSGDLFIEVKNCHLLRRDDGVSEFPDCVTARGLKHLRELVRVIDEGGRAMLLFIVQRSDAVSVTTAQDLDPKYAEGFRWAAEQGVAMRAVRCTVTQGDITPDLALPVIV
ncbi:MAG: DNA/RNA nuclease SfsA [Pseudomonadota bacterium]